MDFLKGALDFLKGRVLELGVVRCFPNIWYIFLNFYFLFFIFKRSSGHDCIDFGFIFIQ